VPPRGVYVTTASLDGVAYPSITNIGTRPTFENGEETVVEEQKQTTKTTKTEADKNTKI